MRDHRPQRGRTSDAHWLYRPYSSPPTGTHVGGRPPSGGALTSFGYPRFLPWQAPLVLCPWSSEAWCAPVGGVRLCPFALGESATFACRFSPSCRVVLQKRPNEPLKEAVLGCKRGHIRAQKRPFCNALMLRRLQGMAARLPEAGFFPGASTKFCRTGN